jgi:lambda repressor-like predicted transcriptional regulator
MKRHPSITTSASKEDKGARDEAIRELRAKGASLAELAERFGLSTTHLSKICNGER